MAIELEYGESKVIVFQATRVAYRFVILSFIIVAFFIIQVLSAHVNEIKIIPSDRGY